MAVSVQDLLRQKELTYIELPPDLQKVTKRPDTNVISDKDRTASSRTPQLDPKELKKLMASSRPGNPGPSGPQVQQPPAPDQASQAQNNGGQPASQQGAPPPQIQNQISQLQPPVQPSPQIKFGGSMSAGSQIDQATRAAAQNRGGYGGDGGDFRPEPRQDRHVRTRWKCLPTRWGSTSIPISLACCTIVKQQWYALIPESAQWKKGRVVLEFFILKDGSVAGLKVVGSSGDAAMDRPAFGSITGSNPFPPLPRGIPRSLPRSALQLLLQPEHRRQRNPLVAPASCRLSRGHPALAAGVVSTLPTPRRI